MSARRRCRPHVARARDHALESARTPSQLAPELRSPALMHAQVRQLDSVGAALGQRLREAGAGSLHAFAQLAPARVEAICARPVGAGAALLGAARAMLAARLGLTCDVASGAGPPFSVAVRVSRDGSASATTSAAASAANAAANAAKWVLLVSDQDGKLQHLRRFAGSQVAAAPRQQLSFTLPLPAGSSTVHLLHTTALGLDSSVELGPLGTPLAPPPSAAVAARPAQKAPAKKPPAQKPTKKPPQTRAPSMTSLAAPTFAPSPAASTSATATPVGAAASSASMPPARPPPPPSSSLPAARSDAQGVDVLQAIGEMSDDDDDDDMFGDVEHYDDVREDPDAVAAAIFGEEGDDDVSAAVLGGGGPQPSARVVTPRASNNGAPGGRPAQVAGDGVGGTAATLRRFHAPPQKQRPKLDASPSAATSSATIGSAATTPRGTPPPRPSSAPVAGFGRLNALSSRRLATDENAAPSADGSPSLPIYGNGCGCGGGGGSASQPLLLHAKMLAEPAFPTSRLRISQPPATAELPSRVVIKREQPSPPAHQPPPPTQPRPNQPQLQRRQPLLVQPPPTVTTGSRDDRQPQPSLPPSLHHPLRTNGRSASPSSQLHMPLGAEPRQRQPRRETPPAPLTAHTTTQPMDLPPHEPVALLGGTGLAAAPRTSTALNYSYSSASALTSTAGLVASSSSAACSVVTNASSLGASIFSFVGSGTGRRPAPSPACARAEQPYPSCPPPRLRPTPPQPTLSTPPSQHQRGFSANVDEWLAAATGSRAKKPKDGGAAAPRPEPVFAWLGQRAPPTPTPQEPPTAGMTSIHGRKRSLESTSVPFHQHQHQQQHHQQHQHRASTTAQPHLPRSTAQRAMFAEQPSQTDAPAALAAAAAAPLPPEVFFSAASLLAQRQQRQRSAA